MEADARGPRAFQEERAHERVYDFPRLLGAVLLREGCGHCRRLAVQLNVSVGSRLHLASPCTVFMLPMFEKSAIGDVPRVRPVRSLRCSGSSAEALIEVSDGTVLMAVEMGRSVSSEWKKKYIAGMRWNILLRPQSS